MGLWQIRNHTLEAISNDLEQENEIIEVCFALFDKCIDLLYLRSIKEDEHEAFTAICVQVLVKARRLALGSYSLYLDGLELEAGALTRSLIESWQLLQYFREDTKRIEKVFEGRLPKAGDVAKAISKGTFEEERAYELRKRYNDISSHVSLKEEALVPREVTYDEQALKSNMFRLFYLMGSILYSAITCLASTGLSVDELLDEIQLVSEKGFKILR